MGLYLDGRKINSYYGGGYRIFMFIGARGRGKTYLVKKQLFRDYFKNGTKFIWIRTTDTMCEELKKDGGYPLIADLIANREFDFDFEISISEDGTIYLNRDVESENKNWECCGYLMALSTFYKLKGNSFADIQNIAIDEWIAEKGEVIRGDRTWQFINTIQTIGRLRNDYKIFMMSNALDLGDPILNLFFTNVKDYGYYINKEKGAVLWYIEDSDAFNEATANSTCGKIMQGTMYEDNILHNKFTSFDNLYFDKKPTGLVFLCTLEELPYRINVYFGDNTIYVTNDTHNRTRKIFSKNMQSISNESRLIPKNWLDMFRNRYSVGKVLFENEIVRKTFVSFIK